VTCASPFFFMGCRQRVGSPLFPFYRATTTSASPRPLSVSTPSSPYSPHCICAAALDFRPNSPSHSGPDLRLPPFSLMPSGDPRSSPALFPFEGCECLLLFFFFPSVNQAGPPASFEFPHALIPPPARFEFTLI